MNAPNPRDARPKMAAMIESPVGRGGLSAPALGLFTWLVAPYGTDGVPRLAYPVGEIELLALERFDLEPQELARLLTELHDAGAFTLTTEPQS